MCGHRGRAIEVPSRACADGMLGRLPSYTYRVVRIDNDHSMKAKANDKGAYVPPLIERFRLSTPLLSVTESSSLEFYIEEGDFEGFEERGEL